MSPGVWALLFLALAVCGVWYAFLDKEDRRDPYLRAMVGLMALTVLACTAVVWWHTREGWECTSAGGTYYVVGEDSFCD